MTRYEVKQAIKAYYTEHGFTPAKSIDEITDDCMISGLKQFHERLIQLNGKGLRMYTPRNDQAKKRLTSTVWRRKPKPSRG